MQFSFPKKVLQCLECAVEEVKNVEITQELRLTDGMPDIGRVLTAWGQVMLRWPPSRRASKPCTYRRTIQNPE